MSDALHPAFHRWFETHIAQSIVSRMWQINHGRRSKKREADCHESRRVSNLMSLTLARCASMPQRTQHALSPLLSPLLGATQARGGAAPPPDPPPRTPRPFGARRASLRSRSRPRGPRDQPSRYAHDGARDPWPIARNYFSCYVSAVRTRDVRVSENVYIHTDHRSQKQARSSAGTGDRPRGRAR